MVELALKEERDVCAVDAVSSVFMSVLNAPGIDIKEKKAGIIDFITAGTQTVSWVKMCDIGIHGPRIVCHCCGHPVVTAGH
jgi:hypothetical protein